MCFLKSIKNMRINIDLLKKRLVKIREPLTKKSHIFVKKKCIEKCN